MVFRRRLFWWLLRAYVKQWGKRIFFFFLFGLLIFFALIRSAGTIVSKIPLGYRESIGVIGDYTLENLPDPILYKISNGLTTLDKNGIPKPLVATKWEIKNDGKTYIFYLRPDLFFSDNTNLTSHHINYNFSDATVERPNNYTIQFNLKGEYSPFLVTVSRPIFKDGYIGLGEYRIRDISLNGEFVKSLILVSQSPPFHTISYNFYPSEAALKIAFLLGEVSEIQGLTTTKHESLHLDSFRNVEVKKITDSSRLVTLFFNISDPVASDEKVRSALSYAIPDDFSAGQRNYLPYPPTLWATTNSIAEKRVDIEHAKVLLKSSPSASSGATLKLSIKTLNKYKETAEILARGWEQLNVKAAIEVVDTVPVDYQLFLGDFVMPKDPDQYQLWHIGQEDNITHYRNLRIDKLLEDGRKITDIEARKKIYSDFQKYLLADSPAIFLYFPTVYNLIRK